MQLRNINVSFLKAAIIVAVSLAGCSKEAVPVDSSAGVQPAGGNQSASNPAPAAHRRNQGALPKPSRPSAVRTLTLAEGTVLKVRTTTAISTDTHQAGDTFVADLEEPLVDGGRIIAPKGAAAEGRVVDADKGGRAKGRARLAVELSALRLGNGKAIDIQTAAIEKEAHATKAKDAAKIGIGSGIGAAIGAIAGGGKGAVIGAAAGAGAGTGAVLATRGEPAVIPSESVLAFELRSPVVVR